MVTAAGAPEWALVLPAEGGHTGGAGVPWGRPSSCSRDDFYFRSHIGPLSYTTGCSYHLLPSRVTRVLTCQWLCQWEPSIFDHYKSTSLNKSSKNLSQVITSTTSTAVQNLVEIPLCPLLSDSPTGQTAHQIFMLDGSNDYSRKGVPFSAFVDIADHSGDQIAPKPQFWGENRLFPAQYAKY